MVIKTTILKQLLSKAMRAVKNDKLLPITGLIGISTFEDGYIQLNTYDGNNLVAVSKEVGCNINSYVVVEASSFNTLINRLTSEEISLEFKDKFLEVKSGKGTYKFDVAFEDNGSVVEFPQIDAPVDNFNEIPLKELMYAITVNEASVSKTFEQVEIVGAYFGEMLITTNGYLACLTNVNLKEVFGKPLLFNYNTLKLLPIFEGNEKISVAVEDNKVCLYSDDSIIIGNLIPSAERYPAEALLTFLQKDYSFKVEVNKSKLLDALNRLNIFVKPYDKNLIKLIIEEGFLTLKSLTNNAEDSIQVTGEYEDFTFNVDYDYLKSQVSSCYGENIILGFGKETAIILFDGVATHVISIDMEE